VSYKNAEENKKGKLPPIGAKASEAGGSSLATPRLERQKKQKNGVKSRGRGSLCGDTVLHLSPPV
jgi:hypothetical protein